MSMSMLNMDTTMGTDLGMDMDTVLDMDMDTVTDKDRTPGMEMYMESSRNYVPPRHSN
jgi:hypothetical protein